MYKILSIGICYGIQFLTVLFIYNPSILHFKAINELNEPLAA